MKNNWYLKLAGIGLALLLTGCAKTPDSEQQELANNQQAAEAQYQDERDPFESINREVWDFNWEVLDEYVLRPLAVGYSEYLPDPAQKGVRNFVTNLEEPAYAVNSLLQGKLDKTGVATGRFLINTTIGIFGLFDVAGAMGLEQHKEDFGQTMAKAGVGNGPYVMLPAYGPTTVRDGAGDIVDGQIFPMYLFDWPLTLLKTGIKAVYTRADLMQSEQLLYDSSDSYSFVKEAYYQNQNYKIHDGNPPMDEEKDEFDEELLDEID